MFVYDNGLPRPVHTAGHTGARLIEVASDTVVYGFNNGTTEYGFRKLNLDASGITEEWVFQNVLGGWTTDFVIAGGLAYSNTGTVLEPSTPQLIATMAVSGAVAVDVDCAEVFYATSSTNLAVYGTTTFALKRNITVPGLTGTPTRTLRWGATGLAVLSSSKLALISGQAGCP